MLLPSTADPASAQYTSLQNGTHVAQYYTEPWIVCNPRCTPSKTQGQAWSAAYRSDPCQISRDSTTFHTLAPLDSPVQPPQDAIAIFPSIPAYSFSTSQCMVHPTVHVPIFPASNSLYEAENGSRRSGTVTSVTGPEYPPDIGLEFETDHGFIGTHLSGPVHTPQLTHDNYAFQDAILTATTQSTASPQDSSTHIHPAINDCIATSPGIPGLDGFTSKWKSTVLPVAHDPSLSLTDHRSYIPLPHKVIIIDDFFRSAMSSGASGEHARNDPQLHNNVSKAAAHYLLHVNLKQWVCNCGIGFSNHYNANRHVRESASCSTCHKKIGRYGNSTYCRLCLCRGHSFECAR